MQLVISLLLLPFAIAAFFGYIWLLQQPRISLEPHAKAIVLFLVTAGVGLWLFGWKHCGTFLALAGLLMERGFLQRLRNFRQSPSAIAADPAPTRPQPDNEH